MMTLEKDEALAKQKKTILDHVHDGVSIAQEIMEAVEQGVGIAASPAMFWLIFLKDNYSGKGFSGFVSNPQLTVMEQIAQQGGSRTANPPTYPNASYVVSYRGYDIYQESDGYHLSLTGSGKAPTSTNWSSIQEVMDWINLHGILGPKS